MLGEDLQADGIFARDGLIDDHTGRSPDAGDLLGAELAQIVHGLVIAQMLDHRAYEPGGRGHRDGIAPDDLPLEARLQKIVPVLWLRARLDEIGVEGRRVDVIIRRDPIALGIHIIGRQVSGDVRQPFQRQLFLLEGFGGGRAVIDIRLHLTRNSLVADAQGDLRRIGAHRLDFDAVFLTESLLHAQHQGIENLRGVPDDLALRLGGGDEGGVSGPGHGRRQQEAGAERDEMTAIHEFSPRCFFRDDRRIIGGRQEGWPKKLLTPQ